MAEDTAAAHTMRAALLHGREDLRVTRIARPTPGLGEVLVRVIAYAPYGTDVGHYINRGGRYARAYPYGVGADFSGMVESVGPGVETVRPGDRVTALALNHCGACAYCQRGENNLCDDADVSARPRQVCCQEYTLVAANKLAVMPPQVDFDQAAMLAGVVVALNAFELMGVDGDGDGVVAIVGVGAMGLAAIATARALGLRCVALGGTGRRAEIARTLGAETVLSLRAHGEMVTEVALALTDGRGFAHVLETSCSDWGLAQAVQVTARSGNIGLTGGGRLPDAIWTIVVRQIRLVGISCGHHQEQALALIASGALDMRPMITGRATLDQAPAVFAQLAGPEAADVGRIIVDIGRA